jgi:hypothetical protein
VARLSPPSLSGQQIGKWSVGESFAHPTRGERMYRCVCECGTKKDVKHTHLSAGKSNSCGCAWTKHGMSKSKEYRVWDSMVSRCHRTTHHAFKDYGARGIFVCDEWRTFDGFYADMGTQPKDMTLERLDNAQGYNKGNCVWASVTEQARNRRTTKLTVEKVAAIKKLLSDKVAQQKIADMFLVTRSNIGHIAQKSTWREVCQS